MSPVTEGKLKKVLIIARAFPPFQPVGHSIRVVKFIRYLPAMGWLPVVLTIDEQREYETTRKVGSDTLLSEIQPQVRIYRTTACEPSLKFLEQERRFSQRNFLTRILVRGLGGGRRWAFRNLLLPDRYLLWLPFAVRCGQRLIKREGIDVIFATCPPHSAVLVGAVLKLLTGKPLILDYRDDWIDTPWHRSKPAFSRLLESKMESWAVRTADKVINVTEWSKNAFQMRYTKEPTDKFVLIPNGIDLAELTGIDLMSEVSRNSKFTIIHAGSLDGMRNTWGRSAAGFFQAIHDLLEHRPEMKEHLSLIFAGDLPEVHIRLVKELGLSSIVKGLGHLPHKEVLRLIQSADLLLAINYEGWSTLIPGKIYEYWGVGGPPILLLSCPGAASSFVERHSLGYVVEPYNIASIQQVILKVYSQSRTAAPLRISTKGIEVYDRQALTHRLAQILSEV